MTVNCLHSNSSLNMIESILGFVLPTIRELLWTACAAMLAYMVNKLTNQFN
jgi:hypothetical protein